MKYTRSKVRKFAEASLRLNLTLLVSFLLVVFFFGASYWAVYKVVQVQRSKVNYHYLRLMGSIHEHELFLLQAARLADSTDYKPVISNTIKKVDTNGHRDMSIYEGRGDLPSSSFSIIMPSSGTGHIDESSLRDFSLAGTVSDFHRGFWTDSPYPDAQMLLLDLDRDIGLAIPAIEFQPGRGELARNGLLRVIENVKDAIRHQNPPAAQVMKVHWSPGKHFLGGYHQEMLAYVQDDISSKHPGLNNPPRKIIAATLLELSSVNDYGPVLDIPVFESLDLVSPDGVVLAGSGSSTDDYDDGIYLTLDGLLVKRSTGSGNSWHALYHIGYGQIFNEAKWQLFNVLLLFGLCLCAGLTLFWWYRRHVVSPADKYYGSLIDSDTFNRTIIQAAPVALCVIRETGQKLVMQNALALQWLGDTNDIAELTRDWHMFENGSPVCGETCVILDALYLHARFAPTNFQGESVILCAFIDITAHKEAESALVVSRNMANAANAEKSRFLATMSHEIRTPLYGVVGTLELLGLTDLSLQQHGYLRTIQGSSNILLQLISDILDISKIESGEMSLELDKFAPLDIVEEALRNYSAIADSKGLLLYSWIDADVPGVVLGDGMRIRQIINNLLNNAIKFTKVGKVAVYLRVSGRAQGRVRLQWQVVDTGVGISKEQQVNLFKPFFQADNQTHGVSGAGLGLSICWQLCQMMQGVLDVVSAPGLGSSFSFDLELKEVEASVQLPKNRLAEGKGIYVRSPVPELTRNVCQWLARSVGPVVNLDEQQDKEADRSAVLLELLPGALPPLAWQGVRILAEQDASIQPQPWDHGWRVNLHSRMAIAHAVTVALGGDLPLVDTVDQSKRVAHLDLRILLAEDHPVNQALLAEQLERLGCTVTLVSNGEEALQRLDSAEFDAVLTDLNMPVMDGYEFAEKLRLRNARLPIIAVTASALREEGERCISAGMNAWLTKPISLETLHTCLKRVIGQDRYKVPKPEARHQSQAHEAAEDRLEVPNLVLEVFLKTMGEDIEAIKAAVSANDLLEIKRLIHRVRGALAVVKARSLIVACREVEISLEDNDSALADSKLNNLIERIEKAVLQLAGT